MWILTGILLGSIVTSIHDSEEACRGRMAMLNQVKEMQSLDCKSAQKFSTISSGTALRLCTVYTLDGKCAN